MELIKEQMLAFPAIPENLTLVEKLIDDVCSQYKINEDNYGNILVALTEAVNNAICHGCKSNPSKTVKVSFGAENNELIFEVQDEGEGFDFDHLPDPTAPENIEKPNGRGVFLMRNLADTVNFEEHGKKVTLKFKAFNN
jgi:serine/threonine-protein kinase RsbW